jgi:uncharacterized protein YxjI
MFDRRQFMVKERVGFLKLTDTYDIFDLNSSAQLGIAQETVGPLIKVLRLLINKRLLPTSIEVRASDGGPALMTIKRGVGFLRTPVQVLDQTGRQIGSFKSKLFSLGGGFDVFDSGGQKIAEIKGDWKGWNFTLRGPGGEEVGKVTKKWAGIGKELFTTADNYVISLNETAGRNQESVAMLLAAGLAVDTVYKEK